MWRISRSASRDDFLAPAKRRCSSTDIFKHLTGFKAHQARHPACASDKYWKPTIHNEVIYHRYKLQDIFRVNISDINAVMAEAGQGRVEACSRINTFTIGVKANVGSKADTSVRRLGLYSPYATPPEAPCPGVPVVGWGFVAVGLS